MHQYFFLKINNQAIPIKKGPTCVLGLFVFSNIRGQTTCYPPYIFSNDAMSLESNNRRVAKKIKEGYLMPKNHF